MSIATVWEFDLLGGTYLAAAVHGRVERDERADEILKAERHFGVTKPYVLRRMQQAVDVHVAQLRQWLETQADQQHSVYAYCAGSRVPGLFSVAGIDRRLIRASPTPRPTSMGAGSRAPTSRSSPRAAPRCRSRSGLVDAAVPLRRSPAHVSAAGRALVGGQRHVGYARSGVKSPRILWLSPWLRPLARVQVEALHRHGADVLLVTSDQHPESDAARDYELVLDPRFRTAATWRPSFAAWRRIRQYRPDVVVTELVRDPRWIALAGRVPRIQLVHDDRPHDAAEQRPSYELEVFDRWGARSAATVTYSNYVAARVTTRRDVAGTPVHALPLTSDLDPTAVPQPVEHRRDFMMIGRLNPYKNLDVVLRAWQQHIDGNGWRGDKLVLIGDGSIDPA